MPNDPIWSEFNSWLRHQVRVLTDKEITGIHGGKGAPDARRGNPSRSALNRWTKDDYRMTEANLKAIFEATGRCLSVSRTQEEWDAEWSKWFQTYSTARGRADARKPREDGTREPLDQDGTTRGTGQPEDDPTGLVMAAKDLTVRMIQTSKAIRTRSRSHELAQHVSAKVREFEEFIDNASYGRIVRRGDDLRDLLSYTNRCKTEMKATTTLTAASVLTQSSWWHLPGVSAYLEANRRAAERGVTVKRVFIIDDYSEQVASVMQKHTQLGVHVSWIRASALGEPTLRSNVLVWDGATGWRAEMATTGEVSRNWLYTQPSDVRGLLEIFDACESESVGFDSRV